MTPKNIFTIIQELFIKLCKPYLCLLLYMYTFSHGWLLHYQYDYDVSGLHFCGRNVTHTMAVLPSQASFKTTLAFMRVPIPKVTHAA